MGQYRLGCLESGHFSVWARRGGRGSSGHMIGNIHNPQYSQWCLMKNYSDISYFVRAAEEGLVRPRMGTCDQCDSSLPSSPPGLCSGQGKATTGLLVKDIFYFVLLLSDHCSRQLLQEMKFLHIFQIKICVNVKFSWLGRSMSTFMFTFCAGKFKLFTTYFTLKRGLSCVNSHVTF